MIRRLLGVCAIIIALCLPLSIAVRPPLSPSVSPSASSAAATASDTATATLVGIEGFNNSTVPSPWTVVGPADASALHEVIFGFPLANSDWLAETFAAVSEPTHTRYQDFADRQTLIDTVSAPQSTRNAVIGWLYANGFISGVYDRGIAVTLVAAVSSLNALFNCTLTALSNARNDQTAIRAFGTCWMPQSVLDVLSIIDGLVDAPISMQQMSTGPRIQRRTPRHPHAFSGEAPESTADPHTFRTMGNGCPSDTYIPVVSPQFVVAQYNITDRSQSTTPVPQTAATLAGLSGVSYNATDLAYYGSVYLQYANPFVVNNIGLTTSTLPAENGEGALDVSALLSINPTSNNSAFFGSSSFYSSLVAYLHLSEPPSVLSVSYGFGNSDLNYNIELIVTTRMGSSYAGLNYTDSVLMMLGVIGVTVVVASGDNGAVSQANTACSFNNQTAYLTNVDGSMLPQYPAGSPYVLSVGATDFLLGSNDNFNALFTDSNGNLVNTPTACNENPNGDTDSSGNSICFVCQANVFGEEAVNNNDFSDFTSGGGFSQYAPRPSWQSVAVPNYFSQCTAANGCSLPATTDFNPQNRGYPDVSIYGGGYLVGYSDSNPNKPPTLTAEDGTSLSAPLFAAVVSRLNEVAVALTGKTLGFINPLLYRMANDQPNTFRDITVGNNVCPARESTCPGSCEGYYAAPGWDPVTGLGSPNVAAMLTYIAANPTFINVPTLSPTTVMGDPQITGFNKQAFQVHGITGQTYNIISTNSLQFNAEFVFLSNGRCPDELALRTECYGHPGTYIGSAAIRINHGINQSNEEITFEVQSGTLEEGFTVKVNGQTFLPTEQVISFGGTLTEPLVTVKMDCAFVLEMSTANYTIRLDNSDSFLNQRVAMRTELIERLKRMSRRIVMNGGHKRDVSAGKDMSLPHGLLGQTWSSKTYPNQWKHIEGTVEHYHVLDGITGTDFEFNRYQKPQR